MAADVGAGARRERQHRDGGHRQRDAESQFVSQRTDVVLNIIERQFNIGVLAVEPMVKTCAPNVGSASSKQRIIGLREATQLTRRAEALLVT
jgi:hypothetical protein